MLTFTKKKEGGRKKSQLKFASSGAPSTVSSTSMIITSGQNKPGTWKQH